MRRVVVTGMGAVTPLAPKLSRTWEKLIRGESGIKKITRFDAVGMPCQVAGEVLHGVDNPELFNPDQYVSVKDQKKMDYFTIFGMAAAIQAVEDSGWMPTNQEDLDATGVLIGSGIGGLPEIETTVAGLFGAEQKRVSPFFIPASLINLVSGNLSIKYGFSGPNHAVVTACATGAHAIGDAANLIKHGYADVMVAGGTEGAICKVAMAGFSAAKTLSTGFNDRPQEASRPWDRDRDGFVMGEGSGIFVLEELEHAKKRGAKIYAELVGYGLTGDGYHITSPHPEGRGGFRAMEMALKRAGVNVDEVNYINAHGTSTQVGDEIELGAIRRLFGDHMRKVKISSTKSSIGHLLGAAGGIEAAFSVMSICDNIAPPTLNLHNPTIDFEVDLVPLEAKSHQIDMALSNSFGFGGTNAALLFKRFK